MEDLLRLTMTQGTVRASVLLDYLGIGTQRFREWLRRGAFGEEKKKTGHGRERQFDFFEVVMAVASLRIMDVVRHVDVLLSMSKDVRDCIRDFLVAGGNIPTGAKVMRKSTSGEKDTELNSWLVITREGQDWHVRPVWEIDAELLKKIGKGPHGPAVFVVIDVRSIFEDVKSRWAGMAEA